ncbi:MAG TPA: hypothetical protein VL181_09280, partial [Holophagaceae bacterium]|nr:hypothetical protein [Holophagaceae bacterium]
ALAYFTTDAIHEALGHGAACLLQGNRILLLNSAFFRSTPGSFGTDLAGPFANLGVALALALLLRREGPPTTARFFLRLLCAFNLFWASGEMVVSALTGRDDWGFAIASLRAQGLWRLLLGATGVFLYHLAARMLRRSGLGRARGRILYAAAGLAACATALAYAPDRLGAVREAALETFGADLGLLFMASAPAGTPLPWSRGWALAAILAFPLFAATLGRGLSF